MQRTGLPGKKNRISILMLLLVVSFFSKSLAKEESFILLDGTDGAILFESGSVHERVSPCSTFKIALALMGFDSGYLENADLPRWDFQEEYDRYLPVWEKSQTPASWIRYSCVWYSKLLAANLGEGLVEKYLSDFGYGNQDISGGLTRFWLGSSLLISPFEQARFLRRMLMDDLLLFPKTIPVTRSLFFQQELHEGWKLFGKTGWNGAENGIKQIGWFVGWIENGSCVFPFAYLIQDSVIDLSDRVPRTKWFLEEAGAFCESVKK